MWYCKDERKGFAVMVIACKARPEGGLESQNGASAVSPIIRLNPCLSTEVSIEENGGKLAIKSVCKAIFLRFAVSFAVEWLSKYTEARPQGVQGMYGGGGIRTHEGYSPYTISSRAH